MSARWMIAFAAAAVALGAALAPLEAQASGPLWRVQRRVPKKGPQRIVPGGDRPARRQGPSNDFVQRLMQMEPAQRDEFLENNARYQRLPKADRERIEQRLKQFDELPAERREMLVARYQLFSRLGPEQQREARGLYNEWSKLPRERRNRVTAAVRRLSRVESEQRERMMGSARFREMFDADERGMIGRILDLRPAPPPQRDR